MYDASMASLSTICELLNRVMSSYNKIHFWHITSKFILYLDCLIVTYYPQLWISIVVTNSWVNTTVVWYVLTLSRATSKDKADRIILAQCYITPYSNHGNYYCKKVWVQKSWYEYMGLWTCKRLYKSSAINTCSFY